MEGKIFKVLDQIKVNPQKFQTNNEADHFFPKKYLKITPIKETYLNNI
jgi:alpha/beta superfamily hydrolase